MPDLVQCYDCPLLYLRETSVAVQVEKDECYICTYVHDRLTTVCVLLGIVHTVHM